MSRVALAALALPTVRAPWAAPSGAGGAPDPVKCGLTLPSGIAYDLSMLSTVPQDLSVVVTLKQTAEFYMHVCGATQMACSKDDCPSCTVPAAQRAGVQKWDDGQPPRCAAIGDLSTAQWALMDPSNPMGGVKVSYTGGDGGRSAQISFVCDPTVAGAEMRGATEPQSLQYQLTVASAQACAVLPPKHLSWGSLALIFFLVAVVLYVVGGAIYNKKVADLDGLDLLPQWRYWQQLPGLVSDGCSFSYQQASKFVRTARVALRDWRDGRGTKEMRENLAPNEAENE